MAAQLSEHDALVAQLRAHIPAAQGMADRAYAAAHASLNTGTQRDMERVGNKATDLVIALGALRSD
jgi:hypothetical protein